MNEHGGSTLFTYEDNVFVFDALNDVDGILSFVHQFLPGFYDKRFVFLHGSYFIENHGAGNINPTTAGSWPLTLLVINYEYLLQFQCPQEICFNTFFQAATSDFLILPFGTPHVSAISSAVQGALIMQQQFLISSAFPVIVISHMLSPNPFQNRLWGHP